ncbi:hypothetical protein LK06_014185 [Streptomyces pluripotens]|nr:hypothetical protein LK06_014185 [Streptomyces pluripotens]
MGGQRRFRPYEGDDSDAHIPTRNLGRRRRNKGRLWGHRQVPFPRGWKAVSRRADRAFLRGSRLERRIGRWHDPMGWMLLPKLTENGEPDRVKDVPTATALPAHSFNMTSSWLASPRVGSCGCEPGGDDSDG